MDWTQEVQATFRRRVSDGKSAPIPSPSSLCSTATQANLLGQLYTGLCLIRDMAGQCSVTAGQCLGQSQAEEIAKLSATADKMITKCMSEWDKLLH